MILSYRKSSYHFYTLKIPFVHSLPIEQKEAPE